MLDTVVNAGGGDGTGAAGEVGGGFDSDGSTCGTQNGGNSVIQFAVLWWSFEYSSQIVLASELLKVSLIDSPQSSLDELLSISIDLVFW